MGKVCKNCGHVNKDDAVVCEKCFHITDYRLNKDENDLEKSIQELESFTIIPENNLENTRNLAANIGEKIESIKLEDSEKEEDTNNSSKNNRAKTIIFKKQNVTNDTVNQDNEYEYAKEIFENYDKKKGINPNEKKNPEEVAVQNLVNVLNTNVNNVNNVNSDNQSKKINTPPEEKKKKNKPNSNKEKSDIKLPKFLIRTFTFSLLIIAVSFIYLTINRNKTYNMISDSIVKYNANSNSSYSEIYNSLKQDGFRENDIVEVLNNSRIDYKFNATNFIYSLAKDTNKLNSKIEVKRLLNEKGFTANEIEDVIINLDWNKYLTTFIDGCVNKNKEYFKKDLIDIVKNAGFNSSEILSLNNYSNWYRLATKNINSLLNEDGMYDKTSLVKYLVELEYTDKEIEIAINEVGTNRILSEYLNKYVQYRGEFESSRSTYKDILEKAGFSELEINTLLESEDFSHYAKQEIESIISGSADSISKKDLYELLSKKGYTNQEIDSAFEDINWNEMGIKVLEANDNGELSMNDLLSILDKLGYTKEEIEFIKQNYNWNNHVIYYVRNIINNQIGGGKDYIVNLLLEQGYTQDVINTVIKNFDFKNEAVRVLSEYTSDPSNCSKYNATAHLQQLGYSDSEINYAMNSSTINWSLKAINLLNHLGFNSRVDVKNILLAQGYTTSEIVVTLNNLENSINWNSYCLSRLDYFLGEKSDAELCQEFTHYTNKSGGTYSALVSEEYTQEEIKYAFDVYPHPASCSLS